MLYSILSTEKINEYIGVVDTRTDCVYGVQEEIKHIFLLHYATRHGIISTHLLPCGLTVMKHRLDRHVQYIATSMSRISVS